MANFASLNQVHGIKVVRKDLILEKKIDGELNRLFPSDDSITIDGKTFETIADNAKRDYLTLFCLNRVKVVSVAYEAANKNVYGAIIT